MDPFKLHPGQLGLGLAGRQFAADKGKQGQQVSALLRDLGGEDFRQKFGENLFRELTSLSQERDPQLFFESLLNFGMRLEAKDLLPPAMAVYEAIIRECGMPNSESGISKLRTPHSEFHTLAQQAQARLDAINGVGSSAARIEFLSHRFAHDATDARTIAPMLGASVLGGLVGSSLLGKLLGSGTLRGLSARLAAGFASYAAEFSSFALFNRGMTTSPQGSFGDDLKRAALSIGALRSLGFLGNQTFLKLHGFNEFGIPTRLGALARFNQWAIPQFSIFTGMMVAHRFEERFGLRPHADGATLVTDTLASMLSLGVGSHLGHTVLGEGFARFQRELGLRSQLAEQSDKASTVRDFSVLQPAHTLADPMMVMMTGRGKDKETRIFRPGRSRENLKKGSRSVSVSKGKAKSSAADLEFFQASLKRSAPSALSEKHDVRFRKTLQAAVAGRIPSEEAHLKLMQTLQNDWVEKFEMRGAKVQHHTLHEFLSNMKTQGDHPPFWLERFEEAHSSNKLKVTELFVPEQTEDRMQAADPAYAHKISFSIAALQLLEEEMDLPPRVLFQRHEGGFVVNLLPPSLLLKGIKTMHGEDAIQMQMTSELASQEEMRDMMASDTRPIILSASTQNLHNEKNVDPYIAMTHDFFHAYKLSNLGRQTRTEMVRIYLAFERLTPRSEHEKKFVSSVKEALLDGQVGGDSEYHSLWRLVNQAGTSREFLEDLRQGLYEELRDMPRRNQILQNFQEEVGISPDFDSLDPELGPTPRRPSEIPGFVITIADPIFKSLSFAAELEQRAAVHPSPGGNNPVRILQRFLLGDLGREPSLREVEELQSRLQESPQNGIVSNAIVNFGRPIFQIYTREFLDAMAAHLQRRVTDFREKSGRDPTILELGAGDGRWTRALNRRLEKVGIKIRATDLHDPNLGIVFPKDVEQKDALAAAREGDILLGAWWSPKDLLDMDVSSVLQENPHKTLLLLGEGPGGEDADIYHRLAQSLEVTEPKELNETADGRSLMSTGAGMFRKDEFTKLRVFQARKASSSTEEIDFFRKALDQVASGPSVLDETHRQAYRRKLEQTVRGEISPTEATQGLIEILQEDFENQYAARGVSVRRSLLSQLPERHLLLQKSRGSWLQNLHREGLRSDLAVTELRFPHHIYEKLTQGPGNVEFMIFFITLQRVLEKELGLHSQVLHEIHGKDHIFRLLSPALLEEGLRRLALDKPMQIQRVLGVISEAEMRRLMGEDARPIALTDKPQDFHFLKNVHPYILALHDFYHTLRLSRFTAEMRENTAPLYDCLKEVLHFEQEKDFVGIALEKLLDGEQGEQPDFRSVFSFIRNQDPSPEFILELHRVLQKKFSGKPAGERILHAYEQEVLNEKSVTERSRIIRTYGGFGLSLLAGGIGLETFLHPHLAQAADGYFRAGNAHSESLLGLGALALTGLGLAAYRWARRAGGPSLGERLRDFFDGGGSMSPLALISGDFHEIPSVASADSFRPWEKAKPLAMVSRDGEGGGFSKDPNTYRLRLLIAGYFKISIQSPWLNSVMEDYGQTEFPDFQKEKGFPQFLQGINATNYFWLLRSSRFLNLPNEGGPESPHIRLLQRSIAALRHVMELDPLRSGRGTLYDQLLQVAFERALGWGNVEIFDHLLEVLGEKPSIEALEKYLYERHLSYEFQFEYPLWQFALMRDWKNKAWAQRLEGLGFSSRAYYDLANYLNTLESSDLARPFRDEDYNYLKIRSREGEHHRQPINVDWVIDVLQQVLREKAGDEIFKKNLERAIQFCAESAVPLLRFDHLVKSLIGSNPSRFKVLQLKLQPYDISELKSVEKRTHQYRYPLGFEQFINGTVYAAYIQDNYLANKFAKIYEFLPRPDDKSIMHCRFSFFSEMVELWLQGKNKLDREFLLDLLDFQPTPMSQKAKEALEKQEIELKILSSERMEKLLSWKSSGTEKTIPLAVFLPAEKSPTMKPLIVAQEISPKMEQHKMIATALPWVAAIVREFARYDSDAMLDPADKGKRLHVELGSRLEEALYLLLNGDESLLQKSEEVSPYGLGVYLRNLAEKEI